MTAFYTIYGVYLSVISLRTMMIFSLFKSNKRQHDNLIKGATSYIIG